LDKKIVVDLRLSFTTKTVKILLKTSKYQITDVFFGFIFFVFLV